MSNAIMFESIDDGQLCEVNGGFSFKKFFHHTVRDAVIGAGGGAAAGAAGGALAGGVGAAPGAIAGGITGAAGGAATGALSDIASQFHL
jgi:hypothetical protein